MPVIKILEPYTKEEVIKVVTLLRDSGKMEIALYPMVLDTINYYANGPDFWLEIEQPRYKTYGDTALVLVNGFFSDEDSKRVRGVSQGLGAYFTLDNQTQQITNK
jgi:hypothetical protein